MGISRYLNLKYKIQSWYGHLSGNPTEMVAMWTTFDSTDQSTVQYGEHGSSLAKTIDGKMVKFVDGGDNHTVRYMHTVTLTDLKPATKYGM